MTTPNAAVTTQQQMYSATVPGHHPSAMYMAYPTQYNYAPHGMMYHPSGYAPAGMHPHAQYYMQQQQRNYGRGANYGAHAPSTSNDATNAHIGASYPSNSMYPPTDARYAPAAMSGTFPDPFHMMASHPSAMNANAKTGSVVGGGTSSDGAGGSAARSKGGARGDRRGGGVSQTTKTAAPSGPASAGGRSAGVPLTPQQMTYGMSGQYWPHQYNSSYAAPTMGAHMQFHGGHNSPYAPASHARGGPTTAPGAMEGSNARHRGGSRRGGGGGHAWGNGGRSSGRQ
eukprot:g4354.t1